MATQHGMRNGMPVGGWRGRASDHRRQQVKNRGPVLVQDGPTGPVEPEQRDTLSTTTDAFSSIDTTWGSLIDVLDAVEAPSSALLCSPSGFPVKAYGYEHANLVTAARVAGRSFALRRSDAQPGADVIAMETVDGATQTVMVAIRTVRGEHLLTVTADGVSMPVLQAWTRHVAGQLQRSLAQD